ILSFVYFGLPLLSACTMPSAAATAETRSYRLAFINSTALLVEVFLYFDGETCVYVWMNLDDGVVFTNSNKLRDEVKSLMERDLKIQWEYGISRVVGIDVRRKEEIHLSQAHLASQV
ncbi:uncharacterized protein VP01_10412g1, partial [Puccinia sorghi]